MESKLKISTKLVEVTANAESDTLGLSKCFKAYRENDDCNHIVDVSLKGSEVCMTLYNSNTDSNLTLCSFLGRDVQYILNFGSEKEKCFDNYEEALNHLEATEFIN